jgi:4-hydroxy-2-oxoheptanedioate aldolase
VGGECELSTECLRKRIDRGETVFGTFMKLPSSQVVEIFGLAGLDFVILDTEHGPLSFESIETLILAAEVAGINPLVRVYDNDSALIGRALDLGAQGVLVPHISTAEAAARLAEASRFYPEGSRGICRYVRAARFSSTDRGDFFKRANAETLTVAMIEGTEGVANLDAILEVPGIDLVFVGPYDLSQALGVPGEVDNPLVLEAMSQIAKTAQVHKVALGTFADDPKTAVRWAEAGVQLIAVSTDVGLIYEKAKQTVHDLRGAV